MLLLQAKIRCLPGLADTGWFRPGQGITLVTGNNTTTISNALKGLEALNPLYDIKSVAPFEDHHATWVQGGYKKAVIPSKKTAVCTIFSANPDCVKKLATLEESLFATDRIEFGRRLDYTRWVSFVELPASARWSDIAQEMSTLHRALDIDDSSAHDPPADFPSQAVQSDRLKGALAQQCRSWLEQHATHWGPQHKEIYTTCLHAVNLHERFKLACRFLDEYLPPFIRLTPQHSLQSRYTFPELETNLFPKDPLALLLGKISARFNLTKKPFEAETLLRERITEIESSLPPIRDKPILEADRQGIVLRFADRAISTASSRLITTTYLSCLLTHLLWSDLPLLLIDYGEHKPTPEFQQFSAFLEGLSNHTQVILNSAPLAQAIPRDKCKHIHVESSGRMEEHNGPGTDEIQV